MSAIAVGLLIGWLLEGVGLGYVMRRKGFDGYVWMTLGIFLGPIAVVLAISLAFRPVLAEPQVLRTGALKRRGISVLVGVDGSVESEQAIAQVAALLDGPVGKVTLARVVPRDAPPDTKSAAEAELNDTANAHPALDPTAVVLRGDPATALRDYARQSGYDVLVIGTRGHGKSRNILGSVATALARAAGVPVLLVDDDRRAVRAIAS